MTTVVVVVVVVAVVACCCLLLLLWYSSNVLATCVLVLAKFISSSHGPSISPKLEAMIAASLAHTSITIKTPEMV